MSKPARRQTKDELHMAENQVAFRNANQRVPKGFEELEEIAKEEHQTSLVELPTGLLYFRCECSDETCERRIPLTMEDYQRIHRKIDEFCVVRGHVVPAVEYVVERHGEYEVVKKKIPPPQDVKSLKPTPIHFS